MENIRELGALLALLGVVSGCGPVKLFPQEDSTKRPFLYSYSGNGKYDHAAGEIVFHTGESICSWEPPASYQLSGEERAKYCSTYVPQETDPKIISEFLTKLDGQWAQYLVSPDGVVDSGREFRIDRNAGTASLGSKDINFKRLCLSKEVKKPSDYYGFRIVELEASNNQGTAVFAVKFEAPFNGRRNPTLWMTDYDYRRYGQDEWVFTPISVFCPNRSGESSVSVLVFPDR